MPCPLIVMNLATTGGCRSDVKGVVVSSVFGGGAGEGLAAMCGHQSGDQGVWVEKPVSSLGDRKGCLVKDPLPGTSSNFSQWKVVEDV